MWSSAPPSLQRSSLAASPRFCAAAKPEFVFPDGWDDETLMCVRLADAPKPHIDMDGFLTHMAFWGDALRSFVKQNHTLHFDLEDAEKQLGRHLNGTWCRPEGLCEVMQYEIQQGAAMEVCGFLEPPTFVQSIWKFVTRGYQRVLAQQSDFLTGPFFFHDVVQDCSRHVLQSIISSSVCEVDCVISYAHLKKLVASAQNVALPESGLSSSFDASIRRLEVDTKLVLHQLLRDKQAVTMMCHNHTLYIKVTGSKQRNVQPINEADEGVANLKYTIEYLQSHVSILEEKHDEKMKEVKMALRNKKKAVAKFHLAAAKGLEKEIENRSQQMHNLESLLLKISSSHSNREVFGAMKLASASVNQIQAECGLDANSASDFMLDLEQTLEDASEVDRTLSQDVMTDVDTAEIEEELARLDSMDQPTDLEAEDFPSVPRMEMPEQQIRSSFTSSQECSNILS